MGGKKKKHITESSKNFQTKKIHPPERDRLGFKTLKPEILLIGVFILALCLRLLYFNQIISTPVFHGLAVDAEKYESFALQILKGNLTHKDFTYLNPLYPFFLALVYFIFGHSNLPVVFIQILLDSLSCIVIYYIASSLFNKKIAILSAFIYACYGITIFYTCILLAPTVVIFFTILFIASLLVAEEKRQVPIFFISGILFGLTVLARPNIILFLLVLPLWFFAALKDKLGIHRSIQGFLLLLVGFFTVTSLITIRNYSIEKRLSPFSIQGGINFYIGNNPKATGTFMSPHGISDSPIEQVKTSIHYAEKESGKKLTPSQASRYWLFKGLKFINDNPTNAFLLYMKKLAQFWRKEEIPLNIDYSLSKTLAPISQLPFISFGIIAPFALLGIILSLRRKGHMLLTLFVFSYMVSVIIFFVTSRYRLPTAPFLIIYSSYALYRFVETIRARAIKDITIFGALLILLAIGINIPFGCFTIDPSPKHYNNLGVIYNKQGKLDKAVSELKKALSIDSNYAGAYCNLGNVYLKKGLIKEAIDEYEKALQINPDYTEAHTNLGNAYANSGRIDEAIAEHKKVLSLNPNFARGHTNLGSVYAKKGRLAEAISEYKKSLAINPNHAETHYSLGNVYYRKGMLDKAITEFTQALAIKPYFTDAHYKIGLVLESQGKFKDAISAYRKAIKSNPDYVLAYNNIAWIYATSPNVTLRNGEEAISLATKACELNKFKNATLLDTLAAAYAEQGNFANAVDYQHKAIELAPAQIKKELQMRLQLYKRGQAYRDK